MFDIWGVPCDGVAWPEPPALCIFWTGVAPCPGFGVGNPGSFLGSISGNRACSFLYSSWIYLSRSSRSTSTSGFGPAASGLAAGVELLTLIWRFMGGAVRKAGAFGVGTEALRSARLAKNERFPCNRFIHLESRQLKPSRPLFHGWPTGCNHLAAVFPRSWLARLHSHQRHWNSSPSLNPAGLVVSISTRTRALD